jgi:hypothetical protein
MTLTCDCVQCGKPVHVPQKDKNKEEIECMDCAGVEEGYLFDPAKAVKRQSNVKRAWKNIKLVAYLGLILPPFLSLVAVAKVGDLLPESIGKYFDIPLAVFTAVLVSKIAEDLLFGMEEAGN